MMFVPPSLSRPAFLLSTLALLFTFSTHSYAQQADFRKAEQFTPHMMQKMTGSTEVDPEWIEGQDRFWYSYESGQGKNWYFVDADNQQKRLLFDQNEMAAHLAEIFNRPFNSKDLQLEDFEYNTNEELFTFHVDSIKFQYDIDGNNLVKGDTLQEESRERWATYSPDSTWIAFAREHNLYLMRADDPDSTEYQLTEGGEQWYSFQADGSDTTSTERLRSVARWFDDSNKLYAKRQDVRDVEELWVINSLSERPELETYKYPMPGDKHVPQDEIWAFEADTLSDTQGVKLDTNRPDWQDEVLGGAYFNNGGIYTGTESDHLYILRRNREWNQVEVLKANTSTGETEVLFAEESNPYFNVMLANLAIINEGEGDDEEFIWWSERTGWGQYYLYDHEGNLKNRITNGYFTAGDIVKVDTTDRTLYIEGYGREEGVNPYYAQLYRVNFDGSDFERLTPEDADHDVSASEEGNYFVDNISRVDMPTRSVVRNADGEILTTLEETNTGRLTEAGWKAPEPFSIKASDDATDLYGVMWKPFDFDSTKSYPIITYVYPGPQTEPFPIEFSLGRPTALAQLGFVVVAMGQRGGSPIRSKYYHNYGYGDLRDYPLEDNKYGIEQLAARHDFIDASRVGIYGHSGGGFMSTAALLSYPEFYDVAVSSAGNHDNNIYNLWWSEIHNGVEGVTTEVKADSVDSDTVRTEWQARVEPNTELAENLQGHLLLVHGAIDNNVHPSNTIRLADALIKAEKQFDMMILPGQRHGFGEYSPYFERMLWRYFAEHLLGDYRPDEINYNIPDYEG